MGTLENEDVSNQQQTLTESLVSDFITEYKILGLYSIAEDMLNKLHLMDNEVLSKSDRLYFVIQTVFLGEKRLFAIPFRTNIPKNHYHYIAIPKMAGSGKTRKGCTHGLHIAKTIPVTKKALLKSPYSKAYKPLMKDGTFTGFVSEILNWISQFEGNEVDGNYKPFYYSVKLKYLVKAVNS